MRKLTKVSSVCMTQMRTRWLLCNPLILKVAGIQRTWALFILCLIGQGDALMLFTIPSQLPLGLIIVMALTKANILWCVKTSPSEIEIIHRCVSQLKIVVMYTKKLVKACLTKSGIWHVQSKKMIYRNVPKTWSR